MHLRSVMGRKSNRGRHSQFLMKAGVAIFEYITTSIRTPASLCLVAWAQPLLLTAVTSPRLILYGGRQEAPKALDTAMYTNRYSGTLFVNLPCPLGTACGPWVESSIPVATCLTRLSLETALETSRFPSAVVEKGISKYPGKSRVNPAILGLRVFHGDEWGTCQQRHDHTSASLIEQGWADATPPGPGGALQLLCHRAPSTPEAPAPGRKSQDRDLDT